MENIFNVKDYFSLNYGLGKKPDAPKLNKKGLGIGILLTLTVIGAIIGIPMILVNVLKYTGAKKKLEQWQADYDDRYSHWDAELYKFYKKTVDSMDIYNTAMAKIGVDESQVTEAKPFSIHGQRFTGWYRRGADGNWKTNDREITWLFFSNDQIYTYSVQFSLTGEKKKVENTQEFFYTDIVSVRTQTVFEKLDKSKSTDEDTAEEAESEKFKLIVAGDDISFAFTTTEEVSESIRGMKNKIREKKIGKSEKDKKENG